MKEVVKVCAEALIKEKDFLTELDAKIGDGDHGLNMARGATAALEDVEDLNSPTAAQLLRTVGEAFVMNVGGTAGPLYGTGFIEGSKAITSDKLTVDQLHKFMDAFVAAVKRRGHADAGDKTMLDVLIPLAQCFAAGVQKPLIEVLRQGRETVREGVAYTKTIAARRGRASYIGERSIGTEDPGAASAAVIYRAFSDYVIDALERRKASEIPAATTLDA